MVASCIPLTEEKVRAEVYMGNTLLAKTPYVLSFSVNKSRNAPFTFTVQLELNSAVTFPLGEKITIMAGTRGNLKKVMTGEIRETRVDPSFGKPSYFQLTLNGTGILSTLENKRFSRRLRSDGQGMYCLITAGPSNRPQAFYALDAPQQAGPREVALPGYNPAFKSVSEVGGLVVYNSGPASVFDKNTAAGIATPNRQGGGGGSDGTVPVHPHKDLDTGGPAWGVYSAD